MRQKIDFYTALAHEFLTYGKFHLASENKIINR